MLNETIRVLLTATVCTLTFSAASTAENMPGTGVTVRPVESTTKEEKFQHQIIYRALERLGYAVAKPKQVTYQDIHVALGAGAADFTAVHWDPLHKAFFEESGGSAAMDRVGEYITGAVQGYLVDTASYDAGVTNLVDLKKTSISQRFDADGDGRADLAGCPPGWGCERVIEHHLSEYALRGNITHHKGDYDSMLVDVVARLEAGESVIYYTWIPYWVSGALVPGKNVQWIEVPYASLPDGRRDNTKFEGKNLGFAVNSIRIVANKRFLEMNPTAARLFEVATLHINWVSVQNFTMRGGEDALEDIARHADEWIEANQKTFDAWIEAAEDAAKSN